MDDFVRGMGAYQWQIRYVDDVFLCLYSDWYEKSPGRSEIMNCRSIMPWLDTTQFDSHKFDFSAIFRRESKPAVYYFSPVFFRETYFGHLILKYSRPDSYDQAFINWLKHVSNALEFLSMKNDIQYLLSCQDLSDSRDILTGMYNKNGLKQAYSATDRSMNLIMLRICQFDPTPFTLENDYKLTALTEVSRSVQQFCKTGDICGYIGENTFVCLVRSTADPELICDALTAVIVRNKTYMERFGMNTFFCTGVPCNGRELADLCEETSRRIADLRRSEEVRRSLPHFREMLNLRSVIYTDPQRTFEPFYYDLSDLSKNSIRIMYRRIFGISINQDCINARVTMAKYYLTATSLALTEIAEKCGYIDYKYFLRQFNVNMGITAGQYRVNLGYAVHE